MYVRLPSRIRGGGDGHGGRWVGEACSRHNALGRQTEAPLAHLIVVLVRREHMLHIVGEDAHQALDTGNGTRSCQAVCKRSSWLFIEYY